MKKKKKQLFFRRIIIFFVLVIIGCVIYLINIDKPIQTFDKYNPVAQEKIKEYGIIDQINKNNYSKTLEKVLNDNTYNNDYLINYFLIDYQEDDNFTEQVNKFLSNKYDPTTINNIYKDYDDETIIFLLSQDKKVDLNYLKIKNFDYNNYSRYEQYKNKNNLTIDKIVTYVNIGLDYEYYTKYEKVSNEESPFVLVNKYHKLDQNYIPSDLVQLYNGKYIKEVAKEPLMELINVAKTNGINFVPRSVYRSYSYQNENYIYYVNRDGKAKADTYSARPGFSEHQTGLAIDLATPDNVFIKDDTNEYYWLKENAHKYGFIIRYQPGMEKITGYKFEPWHIRYVGKENSEKINELNITYDEYYDMYLKENK